MSASSLPSVSMARYIHDKLKLYRIGLPLALSIAAGLTIGASVFALRAKSDLQLINSISGHLSSLVETHDRPEMLKILKSIANSRGVTLRVIHRGKIVASSAQGSELDSVFEHPKPIFAVAGHEFTTQEMISMLGIARIDGPKVDSMIEISTPIHPLLFFCLIVVLGILLLSFVSSQFYANQITRTIREALQPVEDLEKLVQGLTHFDTDPAYNSTGIRELDNIQGVIIETKRSLSDATDRLAQSKAKELVADTYGKLIHDLYTPVAALKESIKRVQASDSENLKTLNEKMVRLATQVFNQVTTANASLGHEPKILDHKDIRICVTEASDQAFMAFKNDKGVVVNHKIPNAPILVPHDPEYLKRAITNLVSNALRACRKVVEIEIEKKNATVTVRVSDDGKGIQPEELTLLLHGRTQSQNADRPGFGLPSANHIARLHGGRIVYSDSILGGACFEMRLG